MFLTAQTYAVAFTRAQAMLIVVGDPNTLRVSPLWRFFMQYVHKHRAWEGYRPSWNVSEEVVLAEWVREDLPRNEWERGEEFMDGRRSFILKWRH